MVRSTTTGEKDSISSYHPLALDVWTRAFDPNTGKLPKNFHPDTVFNPDLVSSYDLAHMTAERESEKIEDPVLRTLGATALFSLTTNQASRNGRYFNSESQQALRDALGVDYRRYVYGDASPAELTSLVGKHGDLVTSLEIARTTHVGDWLSRRASISGPVRQNILEAADSTSPMYIADMDASETEGALPRYKAKILHEDGFMIERKRAILRSFGGNVLTVMRINFLVNPNDASIPDSLRDHLEGELKKFTDRNRSEYDFEAENQLLRKMIEPAVRSRNPDDKPSYLMPLQTALYSYSLSEHEREQQEANEMRAAKRSREQERQAAYAAEVAEYAAQEERVRQSMRQEWQERQSSLLSSAELE